MKIYDITFKNEMSFYILAESAEQAIVMAVEDTGWNINFFVVQAEHGLDKPLLIATEEHHYY